MRYTVKKRCLLCRKVLDENKRCTNQDCIMSKAPHNTTDKADSVADDKATDDREDG